MAKEKVEATKNESSIQKEVDKVVEEAQSAAKKEMDEDAVSESKKDLIEKEKDALMAKQKLSKDMVANKKK